MIILAIWPLATGLFCLWTAFRRYNFIKMIIHYPKMNLSAIKEGPVTVFGKIKAHEKSLRAPVSKTECVFYNLKLEQEPRFPKRRRSINAYKKVFEEEEGTCFYIENNTGKLLIDPEQLDYNVFMGITVSEYNQTELTFEDMTSDHSSVKLFKKKSDDSILETQMKKYFHIKKGKLTENCRSREFFLKIGSEINLTGNIVKNEQNEFILKKDPNSNIFFMSHLSNAELISNLKFYFFLYTGMVLTVLGITIVIYS